MTRHTTRLLHLALFASIGLAPAQAQGPAQGTWNTNYGEVRLVQDGRTVYGEYDRAILWGQAFEDEGGVIVRGVYQYANADASQLTARDWGTVSLRFRSGILVGMWAYRAIPSRDRLARGDEAWAGLRASGMRPELRSAARFASGWTPDQSLAASVMPWVRSEAPPTASGPTPTPPSGMAPGADDAPTLSAPSQIEVTVVGLRAWDFIEDGVGTSRNAEIYGTMGIHAFVDAGGSQRVNALANQPPRVWTRSRNEAIDIRRDNGRALIMAPRTSGEPPSKSVTAWVGVSRRFALSADVRSGASPLSISVRSHLTERDGRQNRGGRFDDEIGFAESTVFLHELPLWSAEEEHVGLVTHQVPGSDANIEVVYTIRRVD